MRGLPFLVQKAPPKGRGQIRQTTAGINGNKMLPE